jgi:SAM-dependent methyltransferase
VTEQQKPVWPVGFTRIPDEDWASAPLAESAVNYDNTGDHGWNRNLDPTVAQALSVLDENKRLLDYSCGTAILAERILREIDYPVGVLNVDASAKFLRVAVDKFGHDERVAFRLLDRVAGEQRLRRLDEVADAELIDCGIDVVTSTNAIHLYHDLAETFGTWRQVLRPGGLALICSGNVHNPARGPDEWIIDETVASINEIAATTVATEPLFARYRESLADSSRMAAHKAFRDKVFIAVRPLEQYLDALSGAGFRVLNVFERTVPVSIRDWAEALASYHDAVLGWVGGTRRVEGEPPSDSAVRDRLFLIHHSLQRLFGHDETFPASWTYITCRRRS